MNEYLKDLEKIEFVLTYACTGRCKHCSEGEHETKGELIDSEMAADAVRRVSAVYGIRTVMTFGGEPLLHTGAVYAIMQAAKEMNVPKRQVITNGFFTRDTVRMREVAEGLFRCGVNDLLLSVDAFHQETIPLDVVTAFAKAAKSAGVPIRLQPAWLISSDDRNPYNLKTREILDSFANMGLYPNEGNALKYLTEYFRDSAPANPYVDDPRRVKCLSFEPNGDVLGGNAHKTDIMELLEGYKPKGVEA